MKKSLGLCQSCLYHDELTTDRQLVICKFRHMKPGGVNPEKGYAISTGAGGNFIMIINNEVECPMHA